MAKRAKAPKASRVAQGPVTLDAITRMILDWPKDRDECIRAHQAACHALVNQFIEEMERKDNPAVGIVGTIIFSDGALRVFNNGAVDLRMWLLADGVQRHVNTATYENRGQLVRPEGANYGFPPELDRALFGGFIPAQVKESIPLMTRIRYRLAQWIAPAQAKPTPEIKLQ